MARRRYISTEISIDRAVNELATKCDFAALLYTWMIPHAEDTCLITADSYQLLNKVVPGRKDKTETDIQNAVNAMIELKLVSLTDDRKMLCFPPESFYKYQSYIPERKRRVAGHQKVPDIEEASEQNDPAGEVFKFFNNNISLISPFQAEYLTQAIDVDGIEPKMILDILQDGLGKENKWSWIKKVISNSLSQNIRTPEQYQAKKTERGKKKEKGEDKTFMDIAKEMSEDEQG